ncbi:MAG: ABC transporter ATP-binding protein [Starkeya sp.]|nr:ABC transporter ATP-binding protein [Starkeya sp.]
MSMVPVAEARGVSMVFEGAHALRDVSVPVRPGRITAICGANGSGKSTLLKCLAGLEMPTSGVVTLADRPLVDLSRRDIARQLAVLSQNPETPTGLNVEELVEQGRYPHRRLFTRWSSQDQLICNDAMRMTDVDGIAASLLGRLSGGQRQRAWIAMTLAQSADILLLDEPTTYLDIAHQLDILDLLRRLVREQGKTIVAVLHDINHAARFADHICLLKDGRIIASGSAQKVIRPDHLKSAFSIEAAILHDPRDGVPLCVARR